MSTGVAQRFGRSFSDLFYQVALTKDITGSSSSSAKKDSATQLGTLSLDGDSLKFAATKPKKSWTTFRVSSIHDVKHENDACRVSVGVCMLPAAASYRCHSRDGVKRALVLVVDNEPWRRLDIGAGSTSETGSFYIFTTLGSPNYRCWENPD